MTRKLESIFSLLVVQKIFASFATKADNSFARNGNYFFFRDDVEKKVLILRAKLERIICNGGKYLSQSIVMRKSCFTKEKNKSSCILISTSSDQSRFTFIFCHKNWCFFWSTASTLLFFPERQTHDIKFSVFFPLSSFPSGSNHDFDVSPSRRKQEDNVIL